MSVTVLYLGGVVLSSGHSVDL